MLHYYTLKYNYIWIVIESQVVQLLPSSAPNPSADSCFLPRQELMLADSLPSDGNIFVEDRNNGQKANGRFD